MRTYKLVYKTGYGELCEKTFEASNICSAVIAAQNFCKQNFIHVAYLYSPLGKRYLI